MSFHIQPITLAPFQPLFALDDDALAAIGARRMVADKPHSAPCRVSLTDAAPGERLILLTHRHVDDAASPYRSEGAVFVREAAAEEALEEAGVEGAVVPEPLGTFRYLKMLKRRAARWCVVSVYALEVRVEHDDWHERGQRERLWVSRDEAVRRVDEPDLKALIAAFEG